jgi:glutamate-1-semialdehyde 2,1-aminomutase
LAEHLIERLPAVERIRFTNSGSEAAILAARLARHVTGRRKLVLAEGGYHGTGTFFADAHPDVVRVPYNDLPALERAIDETVAGVFLEPFLGSAGVVPAEPGFLLGAQQAASRAGALFVLDEIQGLRNAYEGVHGLLGLQPDLVLMGKIIGGGVPIGAVGGRAELLDTLASGSGQRLAHSGTFNGNVVAMAAGVVAMSLLDRDAIAELDQRADRIAGAAESAAERHGLPLRVTRAGSIMHAHFLAVPPRNAADAAAGCAVRNQALHLALLVRGIYTAPRGMLNLSTALTEDQVSLVCDGYDAALAEVASQPEMQQ